MFDIPRDFFHRAYVLLVFSCFPYQWLNSPTLALSPYLPPTHPRDCLHSALFRSTALCEKSLMRLSSVAHSPSARGQEAVRGRGLSVQVPAGEIQWVSLAVRPSLNLRTLFNKRDPVQTIETLTSPANSSVRPSCSSGQSLVSIS